MTGQVSPALNVAEAVRARAHSRAHHIVQLRLPGAVTYEGPGDAALSAHFTRLNSRAEPGLRVAMQQTFVNDRHPHRCFHPSFNA